MPATAAPQSESIGAPPADSRDAGEDVPPVSEAAVQPAPIPVVVDPRVAAMEKRMADVASQMSDGYRMLAAAKTAAMRSDPDVADLQRKIAEKREELNARWLAIPELAAMMQRSDEIRSELTALNAEHRDLVEQAKTQPPTEEATTRVHEIRATLNQLSDELGTLTRSMEEAREHARNNDRDLITLTSEIRRLQSEVSEKIDAAPAVVEALAAQRRLVAEGKQISEELANLRGAQGNAENDQE